MKLKKNKGILFWITGLPGSGKTSIAKLLYNRIEKNYGASIIISGDELRKDFNLKGYKKKDRLMIGFMYSNLFKRIINQNINVIFSGGALYNKIQDYNKKKISNYFEIFIDSNLSKNKKIKKISKKNKHVVGIDIRPEYPKKPNIKYYNNFDTSLKVCSDEIFRLIKKKIKF